MPLAARGSPLDGRPKQHQGLCPCKPALAAEGSGARGGEATPHTRADAEPTPKGAGPPPFNLTSLRLRARIREAGTGEGDGSPKPGPASKPAVR